MNNVRILFGTSWKMNKTTSEAVDYIQELIGLLCRDGHDIPAQVFVVPPFTAIAAVAQASAGRFWVGAQNMHWEESGAYTGEISPCMLRELGIDLVELGHAERRQYFNETDAAINLKVGAALRHDIRPLICIGEGAEDRQYAVEKETVARQLRIALKGVPARHAERIIVAYEPAWAIGETKAAADPEYIRLMVRSIRHELSQLLGESSVRTSVLYGGGVDASNATSLLRHGEVDGLFVGRAAWQPEGFASIIRECIGGTLFEGRAS
jgi:triosephosphate isomerase